jgi:uncharacterized membrane protein YphA (DoxX/SURF4 family)
MSALFVLGRTIFGGFFAYNGINHLQHSREIGQYADSKGVPAAEQAVQATGALLLIGGVSVMLGLKPRQGLAALIGFLILVSMQMHRLWYDQDPKTRDNVIAHFMKKWPCRSGLTMLRFAIRAVEWTARVPTKKCGTRRGRDLARCLHSELDPMN